MGCVVVSPNECEKSYNGLQLQEQDLSGLAAVRDDKVKIAARASCKIVRNQVSEQSETPGIIYSQSYITINRGISMKVLRKIIEINEELCDGCGQCIPDCAEGALKVVDGKAKVLADKYCDGLGACLEACPKDALKIIEREADDFDEEAVEELLESMKDKQEKAPAAAPSPGITGLKIETPCQAANKPKFNLGPAKSSDTSLSHWPVQIRLVPAQAPFLQNADLLVAADCVPVAYPHFHRDFLAGRVIMMGCPKFDDVNGYVKKFVEVFQEAKPKSIKLAIMEVPCCSGMRMIVKEALKQAGMDIPMEEVIVGARGEIKE